MSDDWERVGRRLLAEQLRDVQVDLENEFQRIATGLEAGEDVTSEDVTDLRRALYRAERTVEDSLADAVDGASPWADDSPYRPVGAKGRSESEE